MTEPWKQSWEAAAVYRARVRGCLLGGALGDALGHPVEFSSLDRIRATHGPRGVTGLPSGTDGPAGAVALITDDTQMTLFTAEGLLQAHERERLKGIGGAWPRLLRWAYDRWLETQLKPGPEASPMAQPSGGSYEGPRGGLITERWLYARRAPGNACLSGLSHADFVPDPAAELGRPGPVNPDSKGCGTVMRSAPFGLTGVDPATAFDMAARCAQITHGHPTGYYAAGAFAAIVAYILGGDSIEGATLRTLRLLARHPGHEETTTALEQALDLAAEGSPAPEKLEKLGGGWIAEEALAIGVYSALAAPRVEEALLLSVNHSGDSDSTGSICGNILGARYGDHGLPHAWVERVEGRARIAALADDLAAECTTG
ncbi:ADP-ribosylglycohydrolase [Streptomyces sp. F-3]|uniref:ADP-ribosylglycohydrolase n=1 Tax=Streptomyces thermogriseus TaxID=75292 RepID=A0ABN1SZH9_9ACTN|nr:MULTISPECIES: ADP-ribosylglycohydrolase family protein [Streptomyces]MDN5380906.1 ADP-ribosylglycohydrolase family protein [Streptomyces sp. LB8]GAT79878.1 ADP-ribosylglycohydrolase [Streptomyces sp. F-3]